MLVYFIYDRVCALGWRAEPAWSRRWRWLRFWFVFTAGVSYRFNFINYDYPTEPMVYAHATPDIKLAMTQIEEISRKTGGDHSLRVAYDDDATWPLEWYLRDYPNKVYYGASPSRDAMDSPVVIAGDKNISKVRPYLGDRYYEFNYRLIWWPRETYKGLTWQRIRDGLADPVQRGQFWDIVIHRRYTTKTASGIRSIVFRMFVRKDIAAQVWDWGAPAARSRRASGVIEANPYEQGQRTIAAIQQIGSVGMPGTAAGQLNFPRAVAVDAEGRIYVADSGNNRVQVFNADGTFLRQWGSLCKLDTGEGCVAAAMASSMSRGASRWARTAASTSPTPGTIASSVHQRRSVRQQVGHLWLHGRRLGPGESTLRPARPGDWAGWQPVRHGHRQQARAGVHAERLFITQWGGGGVIEGRLDEPVGLGQDADGNWYVSDTWNMRIQKFTEAFSYVSAMAGQRLEQPVGGQQASAGRRCGAQPGVCGGPGELPRAGLWHRRQLQGDVGPLRQRRPVVHAAHRHRGRVGRQGLCGRW